MLPRARRQICLINKNVNSFPYSERFRISHETKNFKSRTRIRIFRRQIWITEMTWIKTYMDTLGVRNTSSETFISAVCK